MADIHKLHRPSISGRIGTAAGSYLAENLPKELERSRLASGLKALGEKKDLSPFQRFAELSSIPGITPQQIESGSRLLEKEQLGNAYKNSAYGEGGAGGGILPENISRSPQRNQTLTEQGKPGTRNIPISPQAEINPENPTAEKYTPKKPWTMERMNSRVAHYIGKGFQPDQAARMAENEESRYLAAPEAEQKIYDRNEAIKDTVETKFDDRIADLLEKKPGTPGERPIYKDITGEQIAKFKKNVQEDLRNNQDLSVDKAIDTWTQKALHLAKTKQNLKTLGSRGNFDKFIKSQDVRNKLETYGKIFRESGNEEEFFNILQQTDENGNGFGLSPLAAAYIAYPRSEQVNSALKNYPNIRNIGIIESPKESRKLAKKVLETLSLNDNPLAIAKYIKDQSPFFDIREFLNTISEDLEKLSPIQQRMVADGLEDISPNWGDISILPFFKGGLK